MRTRHLHIWPTLLLLLTLGTGCELVEDATDLISGITDLDLAQQCINVCSKVERCNATPPALDSGSFSVGSGIADNGIVACGGNCVQTDKRAQFGYSDCQIQCILDSACGDVQACWDANSSVYASFCITTPPTPVQPASMPMEMTSNNTMTGNQQVDELIDDPAVETAVEDGDFPVHYGDKPPVIDGRFEVRGEIDRASNARPVGSPINTTVCFQGTTEGSSGVTVDYCEDGVEGMGTAPITGNAQNFTIYLDVGSATILFSGAYDEATKTAMGIEALVVYKHGVEIWEHSNTDWNRVADCSGCN